MQATDTSCTPQQTHVLFSLNLETQARGSVTTRTPHHLCVCTSPTQLLEHSHRALRLHVTKRMPKPLLYIGRRAFAEILYEFGFGFCRDAVLRKPWRSSFINRVCDCCNRSCIGRATSFGPRRSSFTGTLCEFRFRRALRFQGAELD